MSKLRPGTTVPGYSHTSLPGLNAKSTTPNTYRDGRAPRLLVTKNALIGCRDSSVVLNYSFPMPDAGPGATIFLFDVDNTLLDNDAVIADIRSHLEQEVGADGARRYWLIFEQLRQELGYADYLGALQRFRTEQPHELRILSLSYFLTQYPFNRRLFPGALEVVQSVKRAGHTPVVLSDGDVVFQPIKVRNSGLLEAVEGHALIYIHKEQELADVEKRFPAKHYVLVDDKLRILAAVKKSWGDKVTTVFVRQGHYATDPAILKAYPAADVSVDHIGDLAKRDLAMISSCGRAL